MITLEYFNGTSWEVVGTFTNEAVAWVTLGSDNRNYRTLDENGEVLTDKSALRSIA